jgi:hypothetical protein
MPNKGYKGYWPFVKLTIIGCICAIMTASCMTGQEIIARKTPERISKWSDEKLCRYARWDNPAIKDELLKRGLFIETEFDYMLNGNHQNFPRVGMRKCGMWTFSDDYKLMNKTIMTDGTVREIWEIHKGERVFLFLSAGDYYLVTIENDKITEVKFLKSGALSY